MQYELFHGVTDWRGEQYNQNLLYGVIDWCKWAMLQAGGFENVVATQPSGIYGGHMARLRPVQDPNYTDGQVWESIRSDWVWEPSGVSYKTQPVIASGVYVDSTFYPMASETGNYSHYINYPLGRVIFNSPISPTAVVQADYSYRSVGFTKSKTLWFTELLFGSLNVQRDDFLSATGPYNQLAQARRQLPAVGLELSNRRSSHAYEMGNLQQFVNQDILFYVLAENDEDRDQITDILQHQNDKVIWLPDRNKIKSASGVYPVDLDYRGMPVSSPMLYPQIIEEYGWAKVQITNTTIQNIQTVNNWLYRAVVRATFEAIL